VAELWPISHVDVCCQHCKLSAKDCGDLLLLVLDIASSRGGLSSRASCSLPKYAAVESGSIKLLMYWPCASRLTCSCRCVCTYIFQFQLAVLVGLGIQQS
jgi:hypothetical protein